MTAAAPTRRPESSSPALPPRNGEDERAETKRLAHAAREARRTAQAETCRILEKHAFRLAELARESNLGFLVYLFEMARVAAVDERARLGRG